MTREEAIKVLNGIRHLNYRNFWDEECDEAIDIAIKALSEDKTDIMTREEAIADIKNNIKPVVGGKSLDMAIEALSADAGWIPCSERLPNNDGCVLVTIDDGIEFGKYEDGSWSIWVCEHWDKWDAKGTIAWMPLPEPYERREP